MRLLVVASLLLATAGCASSPVASSSSSLSPEENERVLSIDHYVKVRSTVPSMNGQFAQIYVRERAKARSIMRGASGVVLFVHGAGTPAEVAFDVPYADYSWMAFLASADYDVFAMDMSGYGRSTRPTPMNDPCNLARNQQAQFIPSLMPAPCTPSYSQAATTIASDWSDLGAVVDYLRALRHVDRVSLVGWSLGGPRAGGYTSQHQDRVDKLVLLAPAYNRSAAESPPAQPPESAAMNTQSRQEFVANWDRQVGCPDQYEPAARDSVWSNMIDSDPIGATWGTGVRRAPQTATWGWNGAAVGKMQTPTLMVAGVHDKQVAPARVRELYADLAAPDRVFIDLGCASHNAMWERNHVLLFRASLEWLSRGTVNGSKQGTLRLGYGGAEQQVD